MKVLKEFEKCIKVSLDGGDMEEGLKALNQHFFNDDVCNHWVDGNLVAKYPEIEAENPSLKDAYYTIRRGSYIIVTIQLMEDGSIRQKP